MASLGTHTDDRQRVLDATDIVQLVGESVTLRAKGREYVGLCPFHDDHKPSMCVVPHKGIYHCFSCGAGGDAFAFVMNFHKMGFREALEFLAERGNIKLTPWRPATFSTPGGAPAESDGQPALSRKTILAANLTAWDFFRLILNHAEHGRVARELIERRGLSPEMVSLFGLGASPDKWDGLASTIANKRLESASFVAAGLLKRREGSSGVYDAFRHRLIFPIQDQIGRVVGFGGRRLSDEKREDGTEEAKYLNSAESAVFDKGSTLYALHQAAPAMRSKREAIVVEGYMDAIACHQAGIGNVVATLGTALTAGNARILRRQCETVFLLFDGDEAGQRAAQRAVEVFFAEPVDVRIASLGTVTDAKDPDELLKRAGGRATFDAAIARAVDPLSLLLSRVRSELEGRGVSGQSRVTDEFMTRLTDLGLSRVEPVRRQLIVRRLSELTRVDADTLFSALAAKGARAAAPGAAAAAGASEFDFRRLSLGERLLGCILCDPSLAFSLEEGRDRLILDDVRVDAPMQRVLGAAFDLLGAGEQPSLQSVLASMEDSEGQRTATALASEIDRLADRRLERVRELWGEWLGEAIRMHATRDSLPPAAGDGPAKDDQWGDAVGRLARLRDLSASFGKDRRTIPSAG